MHFGIITKTEKSVFFPPRRICALDEVVSGLSAFLADRDHECLVIMHLSEKMEYLQFTCHLGDEASVMAPTKKIVGDAIELGTKGLILAHNHPSGDASPSTADINFTKQIALLCEQLDVTLLDHLIFAGADWISLRQKGFV
jgi:DNA repair protein RadC